METTNNSNEIALYYPMSLVDCYYDGNVEVTCDHEIKNRREESKGLKTKYLDFYASMKQNKRVYKYHFSSTTKSLDDAEKIISHLSRSICLKHLPSVICQLIFKYTLSNDNEFKIKYFSKYYVNTHIDDMKPLVICSTYKKEVNQLGKILKQDAELIWGKLGKIGIKNLYMTDNMKALTFDEKLTIEEKEETINYIIANNRKALGRILLSSSLWLYSHNDTNHSNSLGFIFRPR